MSATPMYDKPTELINLVNLLLINDNRKEITKNMIFDKDDNITSKGVELLSEYTRGYVSYIRGYNPDMYPYKIIPPESITPKFKYSFNGIKIPDTLQLKHSLLYPCYFSESQYDFYKLYIQKKLKNDLTNSLNNLDENKTNSKPNNNSK